MSISLSERAVKEVKRIVAEQNLPEGTGLRVGVKGGGCSGFSYTLGFDDNQNPTDQLSEVDGVQIMCDPKSFLYLNGTVVDFEDNLMGRGFKFTNPNASKSCGCGESFSV
ncbi:MAG: iron-sulfur cluster assembly accessory protein [Planctomycetes bacterium]|jgi:iron-sulfur cluster assembly protein|nr:iron-sulfur cluster assembly accessory protein [Candidatus Woesearchaeota archaeon]MBJ77851.1 iron-sulfur cluster assembly accessory protein [Planctomycetota bacterium]MBV21083.1 iron-sulfur cluster assembly accessory protein [Planctomycetaceae bacterium]MDP6385355.1 iron-sulfur cluster assembly accessory protein [Planctomycetota bacterium]MDP6740387.1 iron-sulfur cluster assembly accessory protein [Planctomycetota bacterium]